MFTGVSGSGKSSIVFDTIGAEAQRQLNETYTAFIRNRLPKYKQPDVEAIEQLSPAIIIDQRRLGATYVPSRDDCGYLFLSAPPVLRAGTPFVGYSGISPLCGGDRRTVSGMTAEAEGARTPRCHSIRYSHSRNSRRLPNGSFT